MDKLRQFLELDRKIDTKTAEFNYTGGGYKGAEYATEFYNFDNQKNKNKLGYLYYTFDVNVKGKGFTIEYGNNVFFIDDFRTHYRVVPEEEFTVNGKVFGDFDTFMKKNKKLKDAKETIDKTVNEFRQVLIGIINDSFKEVEELKVK